jgi:hypothetical protein
MRTYSANFRSHVQIQQLAGTNYSSQMLTLLHEILNYRFFSRRPDQQRDSFHPTTLNHFAELLIVMQEVVLRFTVRRFTVRRFTAKAAADFRVKRQRLAQHFQ